jgi:hypothetical protein
MLRLNLSALVSGFATAVLMPHGFGDTGDMWAPIAAAQPASGFN